MFSSPRVWLCMPLLIVMGIWEVFAPCSKSNWSYSWLWYALFGNSRSCIASTNDYLCACILGICIVFFQIQAFKYSASLQVQSNRSREDLNAKMPRFLNLNLFVYVFKITLLFFFSLFMWTAVKLVFFHYFQCLVFNCLIFCLFVCFFLLDKLMGKNLGFHSIHFS